MIIGSLTTYPKRYPTVIECLKTILNQTHKLDKLCLNLSIEENLNKEKDLPDNLLSFIRNNNIEIIWTDKNYRSHLKLIPTLLKYPNDTIITFDDDEIYEDYTVEKLLEKSKEYPNCVVSAFSRKLAIWPITKKPLHYVFSLSKLNKGSTKPNFRNLLYGYSGVLYPPHCLYKDVTNYELAIEYCGYMDDFWFWFNAIRNNTKIVPSRMYKDKHDIRVENSSLEQAISKDGSNWKWGKENDKALKKLYNNFKDVYKKL